ncbi:MAG TPA: ThiF family adenylyltransferase [Pyrinomonadaceae bacterium]
MDSLLSELADRAKEARKEAGIWQASFFTPADRASRVALERLLASNAVLFVHDEIHAQLIGLVEARLPPGQRLTRDELEREAARIVTPQEEANYGTWVYYPWSRRLIHILPEAEYRELRTRRNRNKITAEEQDRLRSLRLGSVGLSMGFPTALTAVLEEVGGEFRLADFDHLELSNMNRLPFGLDGLGVKKAVLSARRILEINPYARVRVFEAGVTDENMDSFLLAGGKLDLLIEECDSMAMKLKIRERCRALGIPVIMATTDRGMLDVERFDREPDRPILHGVSGGLRASDFVTLPHEQKVKMAFRIVDINHISERLAASMLDIKNWPQLASHVALGAGINVDTIRRIALGHFQTSGRFYIDLEELISEGEAAPIDFSADAEFDVVNELHSRAKRG